MVLVAAVAARRRGRLRGRRVRDEFVEEAGEHGRVSVDRQHVGAASVRDPQSRRPERRRVAVAAAADTGRLVERLHINTMCHMSVPARPAAAFLLTCSSTQDVCSSNCTLVQLRFTAMRRYPAERANSAPPLQNSSPSARCVQVARWSGSRVPRRRLSPSVGRWSSPTAVQFR